MSELSFFGNLKSLKSDMANMTYKQKLEHIWTYYRWMLIVVAILIMVVSILLASFQNLSKKTVMAGVTVNVFLSDEGKAYISDDYKASLGITSEKEEVYLSHSDIADAASATNFSENYYAVMSLLALCANEEVDYLLLNQVGFETMLVQGAYLDLTKVYTAEELEAFGDRVVYAQTNQESEPTPMALKITDSPFIQDNADNKGDIYFVFVANSPRTEECRAFFDYMMAWKSE